MSRPKPIAYSPIAQTTSLLGSNAVTDLTVTVSPISAFPTLAAGEVGYVVFCANEKFNSNDPADYETCTYEAISTNDLTTLTRGVEGTVQEWPIGTYCASFITADAMDKTWEKMYDIESTLTEQDEEWVVV